MWASSLPFVVERPHGLSRAVRMYAIDCPELDVHTTWLMVDTTPGDPRRVSSVTVILPRADTGERARSTHVSGRAERGGAPIAWEVEMADRVMLKVDPLAAREQVEDVVLMAYVAAMSAPRP